MELFKLLGKIIIDNAEARKALQDVSNEGQQTESKLSKAFGAFGKGAAIAGKAIATGLAVGGAAMAGLTTKALQAAGDLEQNMGGAEAVFGELGKTIGDMKTPMQTFNAETGKVETSTKSLEEVSKQAFQNMGLSQSDYLATANKMGALFKGAGFETQEALNLSSQAMQRAADVASIMGIDTEAAMEAVAGAAKGNFTMMDNLGVAMNDTAIGAYALEKGINKTTAEMSQQEKIGLAMEMFLDKTSYAAGNYAKENATLAGSLGTAKAAMTNFLAGSGDVDSLVSSFSNLANVVVKSISEIAPRLTKGLSDLVQQVVPLIPPLLNQLLPVLVEGATTLISGLVSAMPGIIQAIMNVLPALIDAVMQLITQLATALPQIIEPIVSALPQIINAIVSALPALIPALIDGLVQIIVMLCTSLPQIIQPIIDNLPTIIISIVNALVQNLPALIQGAIQLIMGIVTALPQIIQALVDAIPTIVSLVVEAVLSNLPAIIMGLIQVVMGIVVALPQILGSLISAIPAALSGVWDGIANVFSNLGSWFGEKFKGAKDAAVNAWSDAKEKWNGVKTKVVDGFNDLKDKVSTKFKESKDAAEKKWSDAKSKWSDVKNKVVDGFSDLKTKIGTKFNDAKTTAQQKWSDAKSKFNTVKNNVVSAFSNLKDNIGTKFNEAKTAAQQKWSDAKSKFNTVKNNVVSAFSNLKDNIGTKFTEAKNRAISAFSDIKSKFVNIGSNIVRGIWSGLSSSLGWLKSMISGWVGNVKSFIKNLFGIHSPSTWARDEIGKMLAEGVAVGIESEISSVEAAMEELGTRTFEAAKRTMDDGTISDIIQEVNKEAAASLQKAASNLNNATFAAGQRNIQDSAIAESLAGWTEKTVAAVEKQYDTFSVYNELTLADEAAYWDKARKLFSEGTEERISLDKKYFETSRKLGEEQQKFDEEAFKNQESLAKEAESIENNKVKSAAERLETYKLYNKVTLADEVAFWNKVRQQFKEGTANRIEADKKYFEASTKLEEEHKKFDEDNAKDAENIIKNLEALKNNTVKTAQQRLDDYKVYNELTLADEVAFWDKVRQQCEEGTAVRIEADKKYFTAKEDMNAEILKAEETLQKSLDEINQRAVKRADDLAHSFSIFESGIIDETELTSDDMMNNLTSQLNTLTFWEQEMGFLKSRIGEGALYEEIKALGVDGLNQVRALNKMNDHEMKQYITLYEQRYKKASAIAGKELQKEVKADKEKAFKTYGETLEGLGVVIQEYSPELQEEATTVFEGVRMKIAEKMGLAKDDIRVILTGIQEMLSSFNFQFGGISVDNVGFLTGLNGTDIEWHSKAMNHAMLLDKPTIFGYDAAKGNYLGAGEAGTEVVAGSHTLMNMISNAVQEQNSTMTYYMQKIIEVLAKYFPQVVDSMGRPIVFDSVAAANAMAVPMNEALGKLTSRKDRGR